MMKKWLSLIVLMGGVVSAALAQDATREASPFYRAYHVADSAELVQNGEQYEFVVKGYEPTGCQIPAITATERVGEALFIDMYQELPFDTVCTMMAIEYEQRFDVTEAIKPTDDSTPVKAIVFNGQIYGVENYDPATPAVLSTLWVRGPLPYEGIKIEHTEGGIEVTLSGTLTDGCAIPVYRAVPDWQNEGFTTVEAYTIVNIAASCIQVLTPFEAVMTTTPFDSLAINGVSVPFDPAISQPTQEFVEQALSITSATAEWVEGLQPNLKITVTGVTDGCEAPIQLVPQRPVDNTTVIKVVRVMPADTVCPMIAKDFTEELMFTPNMNNDSLMFFIGDQTVTVDINK